MNRVVVTGIGVIAPGSIGKAALWENLSTAKVCTGPIELPAYEELRVKIAGRIEKFLEKDYLSDQNGINFRALDTVDKYALKTIDTALRDSGLDLQSVENKVALSFGTTMGKVTKEIDNKIDYRLYEAFLQKDTQARDKLLQKLCPGNILSTICRYFGLRDADARMFFNACAAGNYSIGWGYDKIKFGDAQVAIVGGVDAFSLTALIGFNRLLSLTPDVCRPFDKNRKGLIVSEGCGVLILEELSAAAARGARSYGEIKGYGLSVDAYHITALRPDASGPIACMEKALKNANLTPADVDYISAHGTGTKLNDKIEAKAICTVFGEKTPPVSSIKSMVGHSLGAAAAIEAVASLLMLEHNVALPTANFETPDEDCPLDCVPNQSRPMQINNIVSNAFAFGGNNSSLVISRCEEG